MDDFGAPPWIGNLHILMGIYWRSCGKPNRRTHHFFGGSLFLDKPILVGGLEHLDYFFHITGGYPHESQD